MAENRLGPILPGTVIAEPLGAWVLEERTTVETLERLDRFHTAILDFPAQLAREETALHVVVSDRRARPGWGGYIVPIFVLAGRSGSVVSLRSDLANLVRRDVLDSMAGALMGETEFARLRAVTKRLIPYAYILGGDVLYAERPMLRPTDGRATLLSRNDHRGGDLRRRFDGEIFVMNGSRGEIAAWSALKLKSPDVWEIAVVTEPMYRGRGYAKRVVAAAAEYALEHDRIPIYVHDDANAASARVCRSLGFVEYARTFFCEY